MGSNKKKSTSEKILDLINPVPISYDAEDDQHEDTTAKLVDKYDEEFGESDNEFRSKKHVAFVEDDDERYSGKKVSRKALHSDDTGFKGQFSGEYEVSDDLDDTNYSGDSDDASESGVLNESVDDSDDAEEDNDSSIDDSASDNDSGENLTPYGEFKHISGQNVDAGVERGNCVRNQLRLWDNLLECRIQLQKCLVSANKMPHYEVFNRFMTDGDPELTDQLEKCKKNTKNLLDKLIDVRETLLASYPETKNIGQSDLSGPKPPNNSMDEEIPSDSDMEGTLEVETTKKVSQKGKKRKLEDYESVLDLQHKEFTHFRNATIQKWNDKTRIAGGNINSRNFSTFEQPTLKQIEQILSNRQRLIQRTRMKRSAYDILGHDLFSKTENREQIFPESEINISTMNLEDKSKEFNSEIFDDTDFYHQLLRELIERKSSDMTDPVQLGRQWVEIQKFRSKMKRKIDVKATKGRRIRYVVHPKLVNFMAPVSENGWTEEAKSELFSSLFGNILKNNVK